MHRRGDVRHHHLSILLLILSLILSAWLGVPGAEGAGGSFGGGDGSAGNPYVIEDVRDLQNMSSNLSAHYVLDKDINASMTVTWNSGAGFVPVGNETNPFNGTLNGNNHTISGLFIYRLSARGVGLFGYIGTNGSVRNVTLSNCDVTGERYVGGLVGFSYGDVTACSVKGNVSGRMLCIGALVGLNSGGTLSGSKAMGNVSGDYRVGGGVGLNSGIVSDCISLAAVTGQGNGIGGLVGRNSEGIVTGSEAHGNVTGGWSVGGLIGGSYRGIINDSHATGDVFNSGQATGGLSGSASGTVSNCYATGNVSAQDGFAGGLLGYNYGYLTASYATGNVTGTYRVGGLVGHNANWVNDSYATGNVNGSSTYIGGLVGGDYEGTITNSSASGDVYGIGTKVGGLLGLSLRGTVSHCHATGDVVGDGDEVGGLVGYTSGPVNDSYATGNVKAPRSDVGGLIGRTFSSVSRSYATGNATCPGDRVGGLVGYCALSVTDSHATGNVSGASSTGGLIGYHGSSDLTNCYANGDVNGSGNGVGGLAGSKGYGNVTNSYATGDVSGKDYVGGLFGGHGYDIVFNCSATGDVTGIDYVGGFAGRSTSSLNLSFATGNVTGTGSYIGGFIGEFNKGNVSRCYATGIVKGGSYVGGFVGSNSQGISTYCYALGDGSGTENVGGFVGYNEGTMNNSYSWGNVTRSSGRSTAFGGFVGYNYRGMSIDCYSTGKVTYSGSANPTTKGFAGDVDTGGTYQMTGCFWDNRTSKQTSTSGNATGNVTNEMKSRRTFTNVSWDFIDVWCIRESVTYPLLRWQDGGYPYADAGPDRKVDKDTLVKFDGSNSTDDVGIINYTWTFWDGAFKAIYGVQPTYRFDNYGVFVVILNVTNAAGNEATDTMTVTLIDIVPPEADAGPDQVVDEDTPMTFDGNGSTDDDGVVNWTWTFTDEVPVILYGARPTYVFITPGLFVVTLNVTDAAGNWGTDTVVIVVNDITPPEVDAGSDQRVDEGTLVAFDGSGSTDNIGIVNYTWTFTDGAPVILYGPLPTYLFDDPGAFLVTLNVTDAAGNWNASTMTVTVNDITSPVADAGSDRTVDASTPMTFNGSGCSDNVGIVSYRWTFIDGDPVMLHGVLSSYTFNAPGEFEVTLTVVDGAGNSDTDTMTVTVVDMMSPAADAGPDQTVDEGTRVTFDGSGSTDNVGIVNWTWTFYYITFFPETPPIILFGETAHFTFEKPGVYEVRLTVKDAAGHSSTDLMNVTVNDLTPPIADAGPDQVVDEGDLVEFDGSDSFDIGGIVNHTWTFEVGGSEVVLFGRRPTYTFDVPGVYVVDLRVADAAGHWSTDTMEVTVNDVTGPTADAGPHMTVDEGSLVTFDGSGSYGEDGIVHYTWFFDAVTGPVLLIGVSPSYTFEVPGIYLVSLTVTDAAGHQDYDDMYLTVNDTTPPVADAGINREVPAGSTVLLDGSLSVDNVGIARYLWDLTYDGQAQSLGGETVPFTFEEGGIYEVVLTVIDKSGLIDEDLVVITVVDTGRVMGTVLDEDGRPVGVATVEITASNGVTFKTTTAENGTFRVDIHHGPFNWTISKDDYEPISGDSSVGPMDGTELELAEHPLVRKDEGGSSSMLIIIIVLVVLVIVGVTLIVMMKRGVGGPEGK